MINRIQKLIMLVIVFTLIATQIASAHSTLQGGTINWGEYSGWSIHEGIHTNSTTITYKFYDGDRNLTDTIKSLVRNGASKWSSYGTISESSSGTGKIQTFISSNDTVAEFYDTATDFNGHLTYWTIRFARNKNITSVTAAHEFGHVYGLKDLTDFSNLDKLMITYEERTATAPTTQDIKGFRVIMGQHVYHNSWSYKAVPGYPASVSVHLRYCQVCSGYFIESCSPSSGMCSACQIRH
ncbi:hypothetical protein EHE19_018095 [Ruminiclostridium herbifermentans]|uniref:Peptidase M10 metallopeptidase domain-containing protein n=1 Tax=Ruminiclostridium herbifermentans TaxID=2488810 RepID=A0A4U7J975_9FIRM|nr:hypothetical protein [Ruminiclostridium herbifermentans]QNU66726.1 hypothetical protein EHE19_018095 [Ruminiclostridium herbifermentans]